jgi:hypothetical protein
VDYSFKINAPAVVSEIIDGEAVIMNLRSGHYFSTQNSGSVVWGWIEEGRTYASLLEALPAHFEGDPAAMREGVDRFIEELLRHELIVRATPNGAQPVSPLGPPVARQAFTPPVLNVFSDMQDLLLLDPIHDVDEGGWPMPKSQATAPPDEG